MIGVFAQEYHHIMVARLTAHNSGSVSELWRLVCDRLRPQFLSHFAMAMRNTLLGDGDISGRTLSRSSWTQCYRLNQAWRNWQNSVSLLEDRSRKDSLRTSCDSLCLPNCRISMRADAQPEVSGNGMACIDPDVFQPMISQSDLAKSTPTA